MTERWEIVGMWFDGVAACRECFEENDPDTDYDHLPQGEWAVLMGDGHEMLCEFCGERLE